MILSVQGLLELVAKSQAGRTSQGTGPRWASPMFCHLATSLSCRVSVMRGTGSRCIRSGLPRCGSQIINPTPEAWDGGIMEAWAIWRRITLVTERSSSQLP